MEDKRMNDIQGNETQRDDEINLFDLWDDIVENKFWVMLGLLGCLILASIYVFRAAPIFQTKLVVKPVSPNSVVELNAPQLKGVFSKTVDEAFVDARSALLSKEYRRMFYQAYLDEIKSIDGVLKDELTDQQNFTRFDELFSSKVSNEKKDIETFIQVSLELPDAEKAAQLLNAYAEFSLAAKLSELKDTIESKVTVQVNKLEYDAMQLRESYRGDQTRRQLLVNEAHSIAKAVGQTKPVFDKSDIVGTYEPPLYMFGTQALEAEERAIKNRKEISKALPYGEDHFIDKLPEILFKIDQLKSLEIDYAKVSLASIDEQAIVPVAPIKPRKMLILALACVAGLFAGLMLALIMAAFNRHKSKTKSKIGQNG